MDPATFQWLAGIAIAIILTLVGWIVRSFTEKIQELRGEIREAKAEVNAAAGRLDRRIDTLAADDQKIRELVDQKVEKLHIRANEQVEATSDLSVTVAGFQAQFMTRDEHQRYCAQQQSRS